MLQTKQQKRNHRHKSENTTTNQKHMRIVSLWDLNPRPLRSSELVRLHWGRNRTGTMSRSGATGIQQQSSMLLEFVALLNNVGEMEKKTMSR